MSERCRGTGETYKSQGHKYFSADPSIKCPACEAGIPTYTVDWENALLDKIEKKVAEFRVIFGKKPNYLVIGSLFYPILLRYSQKLIGKRITEVKNFRDMTVCFTPISDALRVY
jgi:hypothetical protein